MVNRKAGFADVSGGVACLPGSRNTSRHYEPCIPLQIPPADLRHGFGSRDHRQPWPRIRLFRRGLGNFKHRHAFNQEITRSASSHGEGDWSKFFQGKRPAIL